MLHSHWLKGVATDGSLIGDGPRECCGGRTGAVGWYEVLHSHWLKGVGTDGPLIGRGEPRECCGGRTGAIGWYEGFLFHFSCLVAVCSATFCAVFDITSPGTADAGATSRGFSAMVTVLCSSDWCDN